MAKGVAKTQYVCESCGATFAKWSGQCGSCGEWNTLVEYLVPVASARRGAENGALRAADPSAVVSAAEVLRNTSGETERWSSSIGELDRVCGGGIVPGSVFLVGGQPGIGKSTILTQLSIKISEMKDNSKVYYVSGEESPNQIAGRIKRIVGSQKDQKMAKLDALVFLTSTDVDQVAARVQIDRPRAVIVDSIQSLSTSDLSGLAGSAGQLRECAARLVGVAKQTGAAIFLVGHVTKEGEIAGPKILEHVVDVVLEVSGERTSDVRIVRSLKNRYGPTDEIGLFRLAAEGMVEVADPAELFKSDQTVGKPGAAIAMVQEGSRPMLVEVQALVARSYLPTPRRVARGFSVNRLHVLLAVLERYAKLRLGDHDVYVSIVGNLSLTDPGLDLAVAAALLSAQNGKAWPEQVAFCGEVGLLGEVRKVLGVEKRQSESKRLGYNLKTNKNISTVQDI